MIHVITGHICSGKTTYVREHSGPRDIVVDMDCIARALSGAGACDYDYMPHVMAAAKAARWAAIEKAVVSHRNDALGRAEAAFNVWIVHAYPTDSDRRLYFMMDANVINIDAPAETLIERAMRYRPKSAVDELMRRLRADDHAKKTATPGGGGGACQNDSVGKPHAAATRISDQLSQKPR